jgi:hypothetical protein
MKKGDIIKYEPSPGNSYTAKVNWADEENVGVTIIGPEASGSEAAVLPIGECELVMEYKGNGKKDVRGSMSDDELREAIEKLKGMRFPRVVRARKKTVKAPGKRQTVSRAMALMDNMGVGDINALIQKALKEDKKE